MWPIIVGGLVAAVAGYELLFKPKPGGTAPLNNASTNPATPSTQDVFASAQDPTTVGYALTTDLTSAGLNMPVLVTATAASDGAEAGAYANLVWLAADRSKGVVQWNPNPSDAAAQFHELVTGNLYFVTLPIVPRATVDNHPLDPVYKDPNKAVDDEHNQVAPPPPPPPPPPPQPDPVPPQDPDQDYPGITVVGTVTATSGLNTHIGPGTDYALTSPNDATSGSSVRVMSLDPLPATADAKGGWVKIKTPGGAIGYASAEWISLVNGSLNLPNG